MPNWNEPPKKPWIVEHEPFSRRKVSNQKFYNSTRWRRLRARYIKENPFCVHCLENGLTEPAQVVDHITPINQGGLKLSISNLQSLCHNCHNIKSGKERHDS